jgi:2-polyprenyl-6-methoxyphenol hydroxylase-like FAD-dependent oxidoreductase
MHSTIRRNDMNGNLTAPSTLRSDNGEAPGYHRRAVVIGAGMGGLLAAGALTRHFDDIVLIERDRLDQAMANRKGVPQGRHVHALLARSCVSIGSRFPGYLADLAARGATSGDALEVVRWFHGGGYHATGSAGFEAFIASRAMIEGVLREHLLRTSNVRVLDGTAVDDLTWDATGTRVTGVAISGDTLSADGTLPAGLVIDASGRGSRLTAWLRDRDWPVPEESNVEIGLRYATRMFRRTQGDLDGALAAASIAAPANPHGGLALAIEDDRWLVSISGRNGEQPPTALEGFIDYAATLAGPDIHRLARDAEPLDDGTTYAFQRSTRRHYERLERLPEGLVPMADAICSFNPIYGQGMTVAALEADILDTCLEAGTDGLAARFLAAATPLVDGAWMMATSADLRFTMPDSAMPQPAREMNAYLDRLHLAAHQDVEVARAFCTVMHLMAPPDLLRSPDIVARVMAATSEANAYPVRQAVAVA